MYYYHRLKDLREDHDFKQDYIGSYLNITRQQYQLYESGKREIPVHLLIELAKLYGISIDYLVGLTNDVRSFDGLPYHISKNIAIQNCKNFKIQN